MHSSLLSQSELFFLSSAFGSNFLKVPGFFRWTCTSSAFVVYFPAQAKLQFMVFQKYCSEKSEIHYWYIRHNMIEISEKILKFQQCVPSQSPTNHPICCHLVYHCLCTEKKISQFKWNFDKTLPIISIRLNAAEPYIFSRNNFHFFRHILSCTTKTSKHLVKKNIGQSTLWPSFGQQNILTS